MEATTEEIMNWPKMPCSKCGRMARVHPETGKARKHCIGKSGNLLKKRERRVTLCEGVA